MIWVTCRTERARKRLLQRRDVIIACAQKSVRAVVALAQFIKHLKFNLCVSSIEYASSTYKTPSGYVWLSMSSNTIQNLSTSDSQKLARASFHKGIRIISNVPRLRMSVPISSPVGPPCKDDLKAATGQAHYTFTASLTVPHGTQIQIAIGT